MKGKHSTILIIIVIAVVLGAIAYVIYRIANPASAITNANTNTGGNTNTNTNTSGNSNTNNNNTNNTPPAPSPTPPPVINDPTGQNAYAKNNGTSVYYQSPFSLYETVAQGGWIGVVQGYWENNQYLLIDNGQLSNPDGSVRYIVVNVNDVTIGQ